MIKIQSYTKEAILFKNGIAVIRKSLKIPKAGEYFITEPPSCIHGTFWLERNDIIEVRLTQIEKQSYENLKDIQIKSIKDLQEKNIQIQYKLGDEVEEIEGILLKDNTSNYLAVKSNQNEIVEIVYVNTKDIIKITVEKNNTFEQQQEHVLVFSYKNSEPIEVDFLYLTQGLSWAPAYLVDISKKDKLILTQQATIKNELEDFERINLKLISGYPNIQFEYAKSLLSPDVSLSEFIRSINITPSSRSRRSVLGNQIALNNASFDRDEYEFNSESLYPSDDIYVSEIGEKDLSFEDTILLELAKEKTSFKKVVEWVIPDYRNSDGQIKRDYIDSREQVAWDSLLFANPFNYPLTTGPAEIVENGLFRGQSTIYWSNPGDEVLLRITKALSFKIRAFEKEEKDSREIINWGGNEYQKTNVIGELYFINRRKESIEAIIKKDFTGNIISTDEKPNLTLKEDGVITANPCNELRWKISLQSNEEKTLKYKYSVLVRVDKRYY
jgi:hypothetical protein